MARLHTITVHTDLSVSYHHPDNRNPSLLFQAVTNASSVYQNLDWATGELAGLYPRDTLRIVDEADLPHRKVPLWMHGTKSRIDPYLNPPGS